MNLPLSFILTLLISLTTGTTTLASEHWTRRESSNRPTKAPVIPKLPLAIHYEALCPQSMYFIQHRLHDALQENNCWPRVDLKLYPFGTAKFFNNTDLNLMEVHCQHGEKQCELNALHACILEQLEIQSAFQLINCMLRSYGNVIDECSRHLKLNVTAVKKCKSSRTTAEILTPYGKEALAL